MKNVVSFDVEDYFHVGAFAENIDKSQWATLPSRVEANTDKILEMMAKNGTVGTFFVLGWVADHFPRLVQRIAGAGHEIACHSQEHRRVFDLNPAEFRSDTLAAKQAIENACGVRVRGYRAPNFSITQNSLWALEILAELGFDYDSSIFPVHHPNYGMPAVPRFPFIITTKAGPLVEFPLTTVQLGGSRSPLSGGAYLRVLPYWYMRWGFGYVNTKENQPFCLYLHPWELDAQQPRMNGRFTARLRHYIGLRSTEIKLAKLLKEFDYQLMGTMVDSSRASLTPVALESLAQAS
jgi:polysaccharide deacetylase family protein (PEP-CTERM system associated)